jgi:hypothetical protein
MIKQVLELALGGGNRSTTRDGLLALWDASNGSPVVRSIAAHYLADLMDNKLEELAWNLQALELADALVDEDVKAIDPSLTVRSLLPSLHLNLAADYYDLGRFAESEAHLVDAESLLEWHAEDGGNPYRNMIRSGIERLRSRLRNQAANLSI